MTTTDTATLVLSDEEAELVAAEASAAARVVDEPCRAQAVALAAAARAGAVPAELLDVLADVALASLQGGRARRLYRAEGERLLTRLLLRTPRGDGLQGELDAVNAALRSVVGERVEDVRVAMRAPGHYTVQLSVGRFAVTLAVRPDGVTVESLSA